MVSTVKSLSYIPLEPKSMNLASEELLQKKLEDFSGFNSSWSNVRLFVRGVNVLVKLNEFFCVCVAFHTI